MAYIMNEKTYNNYLKLHYAKLPIHEQAIDLLKNLGKTFKNPYKTYTEINDEPVFVHPNVSDDKILKTTKSDTSGTSLTFETIFPHMATKEV